MTELLTSETSTTADTLSVSDPVDVTPSALPTPSEAVIDDSYRIPDSDSNDKQSIPYDHSRVHDMVLAIRNGTTEVWPQLVNMFEDMITATAWQCDVASYSVQDVVQNTLLQLYTHLDAVEDPSRLAGWLKTVAIRESYRVAKKDNRYIPASNNLEWILNYRQPQTDEDVADRIFDEDRRQFITESAAALTTKQQNLLELLLDESDFSYKEIAEISDIKVGTIGSRRMRIIAALKELSQDQPLFDQELA